VEAFAQVAQGRHDALHIHDHGVHGAGDDGQLLLHEISGQGNAVAHDDSLPVQHMPTTLMPLAPAASARGHQRRIAGRSQDHLRQHRLVPMGHDVDMVFLEHSQVGLGAHRFRRAEEHVGNLGGHHGAAPAVGDGGLEALQDQVDRVVVHADVGAVHDLHDLAVDAARVDTHLLPLVHPFLRRPAGKLEGPFLLAEFGVHRPGQVQGDLLLAAACRWRCRIPAARAASLASSLIS
jgi:hypothetical protein